MPGEDEAISIVGRRAIPAVQAARELLERNLVGDRWTDFDDDPVGRRLRLLRPLAQRGR